MINSGYELQTVSRQEVDPEASKVVNRLVRHGYTAYLVGGCVRDLLLGRSPKDFDVSTDATPSEIRYLFRNSRIIGRRFRLVHIFFGRKIIETSTFRAPPIGEPSPEDDDLLIWRDNAFGTAAEDARRRDFTINGLFYDLAADRVIDWVGGLADLRAGQVRCIGDPDIRFQEDPVRMLRAIKFAARLGMAIEDSTKRAIITHRGAIARCSAARLLEESYRLLHSGKSVATFRLLHQLGMMRVLFPEIASVLDDPDDPEASRPAPVFTAGRGRAARQVGRDSFALQADAEVTGLHLRARQELRRAPHEPTAYDSFAQLARRVGIDSDDRRREVADAFWSHLDALDDVVKGAEKPPGHPVLLGALLSGLVYQRYDGRCASAERIDTLVRSLTTRTQVSRRDKERLRLILMAQRRLASKPARTQFIQRDYFRDALQLLQIRERANGHEGAAAEAWQRLLATRRRSTRRFRSTARALGS